MSHENTHVFMGTETIVYKKQPKQQLKRPVPNLISLHAINFLDFALTICDAIDKSDQADTSDSELVDSSRTKKISSCKVSSPTSTKIKKPKVIWLT